MWKLITFVGAIVFLYYAYLRYPAFTVVVDKFLAWCRTQFDKLTNKTQQ